MRKIIRGDVILNRLHLTELFDLSDVEVKGSFYCSTNDLTSLVGSPHTVGGTFNCSNNNLTNLVGCPHTVNHFYCNNNNLSSLVGAPSAVDGFFVCHNNPLTSLEGIPKTVGVNFMITKTLKDKFPEEYIRSLCKIKGYVSYI